MSEPRWWRKRLRLDVSVRSSDDHLENDGLDDEIIRWRQVRVRLVTYLAKPWWPNVGEAITDAMTDQRWRDGVRFGWPYGWFMRPLIMPASFSMLEVPRGRLKNCPGGSLESCDFAMNQAGDVVAQGERIPASWNATGASPEVFQFAVPRPELFIRPNISPCNEFTPNGWTHDGQRDVDICDNCGTHRRRHHGQ